MNEKSRYLTACAILLAAAVLLSWPQDRARSDEDRYRSGESRHDDVYRHRSSRDILPFKDILRRVRPHIDGEIIETEFEFEDGMPVYEFKYIDGSGRVMELYVDARDGRILKKRGK